jgi:HAD superfamily hydrolase (TIGR01549 family)
VIPPPRRRRAVLFDMDGTLTRPQFDFDAIRREIGMPAGPILETVAAMPPDERARAEAILHRYEREFAATSELQPGAAEAVAWVSRHGLRSALMTRNSRESADVFLERHGLRFDLVWTRTDGPTKPSPAPVQAICGRLGVQPGDAWVVGDYLYDVQCGRAAGARTVLLLGGDDRPAWSEQADHVIGGLEELIELLKRSAAVTS